MRVSFSFPRSAWERISLISLLLILLLSACVPSSQSSGPHVLAVESFLADITQNVAGDRLKVDTLIPLGVDPHAFQPTPQDAARLENSTILVINGGGLESWLNKTLQNIGGKREMITASAGLPSRTPKAGEPSLGSGETTDPHFWLDPTLAVHYVENIRDGLIQADPAGADTYRKNADAYIAQLRDLDTWIHSQVQQISPARRLLVTNHEDFGYYADRYDLKIVGTVIPSVSTEASPSAQQVGKLVDEIRASGAPAIFLEVGANPQLADQIAKEANVRLVTDLYTHTITPPDGPAPSYIALMRHDTDLIINALK